MLLTPEELKGQGLTEQPWHKITGQKPSALPRIIKPKPQAVKRIYKYQIAEDSRFVLSMHEGAKILKINWQGGKFGYGMMLWALADTDKPLEKRTFAPFTTGMEVPDNLEHIATVEKPNGIVIHYFEET